MRVKLYSNGYTKIYEDGTNISTIGSYENDEEVQNFLANGGVVEPEFTGAELKEQQRQQAQRDRDAALQAITHTFTDGKVVQVRPQDIANFQLAIQQGVDRKWVLEDNTVRFTTVQELAEAMANGINQGEVIWDGYIAVIEAL